uniref:Uncharacterized protein n=1 Tax=Helianthus annuus TaxID=4232 RepID=A0A251SRK7_HELAN
MGGGRSERWAATRDSGFEFNRFSLGLGSVESGGSGSSLDLFRFSFRSLVRVPFDLSPLRSSYGSGLRSTAQFWLGIGVYVGSESSLFRLGDLGVPSSKSFTLVNTWIIGRLGNYFRVARYTPKFIYLLLLCYLLKQCYYFLLNIVSARVFYLLGQSVFPISKDLSTTLVSQCSVQEPSKFLFFIKLMLYFFRSFIMKLSLVNFEPFLRFHFCAYIILILFIRLYIISMHNFTKFYLHFCNNEWRHIIEIGVISLPCRLTPLLSSSYNDLTNGLGVIPLPR